MPDKSFCPIDQSEDMTFADYVTYTHGSSKNQCTHQNKCNGVRSAHSINLIIIKKFFFHLFVIVSRMHKRYIHKIIYA